MPIRQHEDDPELLRQAIDLTARRTGFNLRLVEKDYFCTVVLEYLAARDTPLTFKGGTCLAKIHGDLYRLSEDLDFSISTAVDAARARRSASIVPVREALAALVAEVPGLRILAPLSGANNSTQYNATLGYESLIDGHVEPISIEVGVREPTMLDGHRGAARTLLLNPVNEQPLVAHYPVACLSYQELMAEKVRAALCRREVAIRDFFDVDHAVQLGILNPLAPDFVKLLRRKLEVPRTGAVDISVDRVEQLRRQLEAQLRPVLREHDFDRFDLERAIQTLKRVAQELERR